MNQKSAYASVHFSNKDFSVELGGRWNDHSRYGTNYTYSFNPSYAFDEHYRIFGSIATAFKAPSLYQLFAPAGTGNVNLKPEESVNYEVGLQHTYGKFNDRLVFFYRNTNNGIDYSSLNTPNAPAVGYYNYVNQQARGIEYEVTFQPTEQLTLTGNYTFVTVQEITQSRINFKDTSYNYALRRPTHNFNITAGYQFSKGLYASVSGKYIGDRYDVGGYKKADVRLDSYFIVGVHAEYKFADYLKVFGDVQNIGNKKFYEVRGYNGIPSMFNIGATFNW